MKFGLSALTALLAATLASDWGDSLARELNGRKTPGLYPLSRGASSASFLRTSTHSATSLKISAQPPTVYVLGKFTLQVVALDEGGKVAEAYTGPVTIRIANDASLFGNARLYGTTTVQAVNGVAAFTDLRIDQPGAGYTLRVSGADLSPTTSTSFIAVM